MQTETKSIRDRVLRAVMARARAAGAERMASPWDHNVIALCKRIDRILAAMTEHDIKHGWAERRPNIPNGRRYRGGRSY